MHRSATLRVVIIANTAKCEMFGAAHFALNTAMLTRLQELAIVKQQDAEFCFIKLKEPLDRQDKHIVCSIYSHCLSTHVFYSLVSHAAYLMNFDLYYFFLLLDIH